MTNEDQYLVVGSNDDGEKIKEWWEIHSTLEEAQALVKEKNIDGRNYAWLAEVKRWIEPSNQGDLIEELELHCDRLGLEMRINRYPNCNQAEDTWQIYFKKPGEKGLDVRNYGISCGSKQEIAVEKAVRRLEKI